jgi:hypothetical protein
MAAGAADAPREDLIVTFREPVAELPLLRAVPAMILHDATDRDAAHWRADPRVERVDWAVPLERHGTPALPTDAVLSLTRADGGGLTGAGVTVAVVDSGIDLLHPDLVGRVKANVRLVEGRFVPSEGDRDGHGTHVAGIVAASGDGSGGRWHGVAPAAQLVGIDISGRFTTASALLAYEWLLAHHEEHGIRVVVNAWGRVPNGETFDARDPEIRAIDRLVADGVVVLFSASNRGPGPGTLSLEAMDPRVITVGATDAAGQPMSYSSRGPVAAPVPWTKPDVVAPGDMIVAPRSSGVAPRTDDPDTLYTRYSGTSQSVPHVAGIVAHMLEADPTLMPDEIAVALRASAIDLGATGPDDATGFGLVDGRDALRVARGEPARRDNVLITGGPDVARDETDLRATGRRNLLDLVTQPGVVWETPFVVKPGAREVRVDAQIDGAQAIAIELAQGSRLVRASELIDPAPGVWIMRVRASVPVATRAVATFESELPPQPTRALQSDGRQTAPAPPAPDASGELLGGVQRAVWLPIAMWGAAGAMLGYAVMPRRRREG